MSRAWWWALLVLGIAGAIVFYLLTMPKSVPASELPAHTPDLANGEYMFAAGGCAECHAEPLAKCKDVKIKDEQRLGGGRCLKTDFGIFHVPNISPDKETGIGNWSTLDFVNAMKHGVGPGGVHLYPAFPYASYQHMTYEDLIDLKAYLDTLPAVKHKAEPHRARPFPTTSAARSASGSSSMSTARRSSRMPRQAPRSIAATISSTGLVIAASVIRRATSSAASSRARPLPAPAIRKARARSRISRRAMTGLPIGARRTSPICWKPATRLISMWSAASWRGCRRIWRSSSRKTVRRLPPI